MECLGSDDHRLEYWACKHLETNAYSLLRVCHYLYPVEDDQAYRVALHEALTSLPPEVTFELSVTLHERLIAQIGNQDWLTSRIHT